MLDDNILAGRVKQGDERALEVLFKRYYSILCNHALKIMKDEHAAEDAVQEVFFKFWENRDKISITTSVKSFLFTSVKNHSLNTVKSKGNRVLVGASDANELLIADTVEEDISIYIETEERLRLAMEQLPDKCREVFRLSREEGLSYREIAEITGTSVKTVENHMGKALRNLRATMLSLLLQVF